MASPRCRGDLCNLCIKEEASYGVPVAGDTEYMGTLLTIKDTDAESRQDYYKCGSRKKAGSQLVATSTGYSATFNLVSGLGLTEKLIRCAGILFDPFDSTKTTYYNQTLESYTTLVKVASDEYHLFAGCSFDTLTISASEVGGFIEYSVDVKARHHEMGANTASIKDPTGANYATLNAVATPTGAPVVNSTQWKYGDSSATMTSVINATSWDITISNNLNSHPGLSAEGGIRLEDGMEPTVGEYSVTASLTIPSDGPTWDRIKLDHSDFYNFAIEIDGLRLELIDCIINPAGPSRTSEGNYSETIELDAMGLKMTKLGA